MRILALDSSGAACSVAFWSGGRVRARRFEMPARGQAERLLPMIGEVMAEAGMALGAVDCFAGTIGPGAFTGLRIGLATLRGLALAADRPMLGITSFEAVARATAEAERAGRRLVVAIESKRADLFVQGFLDASVPDGAPASLPLRALDKLFPGEALLVAGDGAARAVPALAAAGRGATMAHAIFPDAAVVAAVAAERIAEASRQPPTPLYLRPPDVNVPAGSAT